MFKVNNKDTWTTLLASSTSKKYKTTGKNLKYIKNSKFLIKEVKKND